MSKVNLAPRSAIGAHALGLVALAAWGCAVSHPPGFDRLVASGVRMDVAATPLVMVGCAPTSYDLPGGEHALVEASEGGGVLAERISFDVRVGQASLACRSGAGKAKLVCRGDEASLELGRGAACATLDAPSFMTTPSCWRGMIVDRGRRYDFDYARLQALSAPVDRVSFYEPDTGRVVQAYEGIVDLSFAIYRDGDAPLEPRQADLLTAAAVALHHWRHRQYCD